jgi:hypothetical protein
MAKYLRTLDLLAQLRAAFPISTLAFRKILHRLLHVRPSESRPGSQRKWFISHLALNQDITATVENPAA